MITSKSDNGPIRRCACTHRVENPGTGAGTQENDVASISHSNRASLIKSLGLLFTTILGVSQSPNHSIESLKQALSSRDGRESLYTLPIGEAIVVIDALERGTREDSPLCADHRRRFFMVLRKMCREHKRLPSSYTITDELRRIGGYPYGGGGNADVWRGVYRGSRVAIKVLRVTSRADLANLERKFCSEVVLWKQFKHPNLLPMMEARKSPQSLIMISEWMEHGTIMDFVIACPETNRLKLLADVARGLKYLHDWPSVHADLKSSNILIDSNHSARIADFGLTSLSCNPSISISVTTPALGGTLRWMAPELFDGKSPPSRESDIYALGMVIYEVFAQRRPFSHVPHYAAPGLALAGKRPSRPANGDIFGLSGDIWTLAERCWDRVPGTRPHAADILTRFETAARDWVSPTSEAITNLGLGHMSDRNPSTSESTDTTSEAVFGIIEGGAASPRETREPRPASNGTERAAVI